MAGVRCRGLTPYLGINHSSTKSTNGLDGERIVEWMFY
jgi:hypothetical protein